MEHRRGGIRPGRRAHQRQEQNVLIKDPLPVNRAVLEQKQTDKRDHGEGAHVGVL